MGRHRNTPAATAPTAPPAEAPASTDAPPATLADDLDEGGAPAEVVPEALPAPPPPPVPAKRYVVRGGPSKIIYRGSVTVIPMGTVFDDQTMDIEYLRSSGVLLDPLGPGGETLAKISFILPIGVDPEAARKLCQDVIDQLAAGG